MQPVQEPCEYGRLLDDERCKRGVEPDGILEDAKSVINTLSIGLFSLVEPGQVGNEEFESLVIRLGKTRGVSISSRGLRCHGICSHQRID